MRAGRRTRALLVGVVVMVVLAHGMFSVAARTDVLQPLKDFVRERITVQLEVQVVIVTHCHDMLVIPRWTERTLRCAISEIFQCWRPGAFTDGAEGQLGATLCTPRCSVGITVVSEASATTGALRASDQIGIIHELFSQRGRGLGSAFGQSVAGRRFRDVRPGQQIFQSLQQRKKISACVSE